MLPAPDRAISKRRISAIAHPPSRTQHAAPSPLLSPCPACPSSFSTVSLATDNKGAQDLAYNPEHHEEVKHIERRHFYTRELVEDQRLVVPYVNTVDNMADFSSPRHYPRRRSIYPLLPELDNELAIERRSGGARQGTGPCARAEVCTPMRGRVSGPAERRRAACASAFNHRLASHVEMLFTSVRGTGGCR